MKLGRRQPIPELTAKAPRLSAFMAYDLPEPPDDVDYVSGLSQIPMHANDRYGCCVFTAIAHLDQAQTAALGSERVSTEDMVLDAYSEVTGFDRGDSSTDQGTVMFEAVAWLMRNGWYGRGFRAFASIDPNNWSEWRLAMGLCGGAINGISLPRVAQRQGTWKMEIAAGDGQIEPGGWGGHAVATLRARIDHNRHPTFTAATWGAEKAIRHTFWDAGYVEEGVVLIPEDWKVPSWAGSAFDLDGLERVVRSLAR